jgi:hypothetical protein
MLPAPGEDQHVVFQPILARNRIKGTDPTICVIGESPIFPELPG